MVLHKVHKRLVSDPPATHILINKSRSFDWLNKEALISVNCAFITAAELHYTRIFRTLQWEAIRICLNQRAFASKQQRDSLFHFLRLSSRIFFAYLLLPRGIYRYVCCSLHSLNWPHSIRVSIVSIIYTGWERRTSLSALCCYLKPPGDWSLSITQFHKDWAEQTMCLQHKKKPTIWHRIVIIQETHPSKVSSYGKAHVHSDEVVNLPLVLSKEMIKTRSKIYCPGGSEQKEVEVEFLYTGNRKG